MNFSAMGLVSDFREKPELIGVNVLPPHAVLKRDEAWRTDLNGRWQFHYYAYPEAAEAADVARENNTAWNEIEVPGCWTRQGYDRPAYTNIVMPFTELPLTVPREDNPTGVYRRTFDVPAAWSCTSKALRAYRSAG